MAQNVIVIGGVALGPKVACRLRRLDSTANVTVIDKDDLFSYGGCGIPYYVSGDVAELTELYSTSSHAIRDVEFFRDCKRVNVLSKTEVTSIDRKEKIVSIKRLGDGSIDILPYDKLVLATGASPVKPPIPGSNLPGVTVVANLHHAKKIKDMLISGQVGNAVVIGGGAIGVEMAEAFTDLWGVKTTLIEMVDQLLPPAFGKDMSRIIVNHMREKDVDVRLSEGVIEILGDHKTGVTGVKTTRSEVECDIVVMAIGVQPNTLLAREAGLAIGPFGGILVDQCLRTTDPNIYAGGDCIELINQVSGQHNPMPLGSLANRQGRVIGTNVNGGNAIFKGTVGTFCLKVFDTGIGRAGLTVRQARAAGFDPVFSLIAQADRAHFYPTHELMYIKLIADRNSRKILGIEAVGKNGDAVKARVDAVAALLPFGVDVDDISNLEVAYAPPLASAMDIVNNSANALDNILRGENCPIEVDEFIALFEKNAVKVIDVRGVPEATPFLEKYGAQWINIPQPELVARVAELSPHETYCLLCDTGPRSFEAQLFLRLHGINKTRNIQGGYGVIKAAFPEFAA